MGARERRLSVLGWHEPVALPAFGIERVFAKLDTGSDHSVLHARDICLRGTEHVEFSLPLFLRQRDCSCFDVGGPRRMSAQIADERIVRSSNGSEEIRYVIEIPIGLWDRMLSVRCSLTDREGMRFPLLLGRSALRHEFLIDSGSSHLTPGSGPCHHAEEEQR